MHSFEPLKCGHLIRTNFNVAFEFVCVYVHVCMAIYILERCLESQASLLSSATPWVSNSCTADKNITVTGCVT